MKPHITEEVNIPYKKNGMVNLVAIGKDLFMNKGCFECHSTIDEKNTNKTGPSLYGLLQKKPKKHSVFDQTQKEEMLKLSLTNNMWIHHCGCQ